MTFKDFKLDKTILEGLESMGFETPTPIQQHAIPLIMENRDMIACAQTGTGKTAAYLLPILHNIVQKQSKQVDTIIIAPTRELALQIDQQLEGFAYFVSVSSLPVYGGGDGASFERQKKALIEGADIIVATPGKLLSHLNLGYVDVSQLQHLVLDEADRMLDMGFHDDIMKIISMLPVDRQTLMFSATMPSRIRELTKKILKNPEEINIAVSKPAEGVMQAAYLVYDRQKVDLLKQLLTGKKNLPSVLIFCSTKSSVKVLDQELRKLRFSVKSIHSDLEQSEREDVMREFRNRQIQILVATDIVSRGIDIDSISLVINYDVPKDAEDYIHRVGRTARAETTGVALTFISDRDQGNFKQIESLVGSEIRKLPLPPDMGPGPDYDPGKRHKMAGKRPWKSKK